MKKVYTPICRIASSAVNGFVLEACFGGDHLVGIACKYWGVRSTREMRLAVIHARFRSKLVLGDDRVMYIRNWQPIFSYHNAAYFKGNIPVR